MRFLSIFGQEWLVDTVIEVGSGNQLTCRAGFSQRRSARRAWATINRVRVDGDSGGHIAAQPRVVTYNAAHAHNAYGESALSTKHEHLACRISHECVAPGIGFNRRVGISVGTCNVTFKVYSKYRWDYRALFFKTLCTDSELSNSNNPAPPLKPQPNPQFT